MTLTIELAGLEVFGYHGVQDDERREGQPFAFDVWLELVPGVPSADRIGATVDYRDVAAAIKSVSDENRFHLLESLAEAVARTLLERFSAERVRVRVRKPSVALGEGLDYAAVTCELPRRR